MLLHCIIVFKCNSKVILSEVQTGGNRLVPDLGCIADVSEPCNPSRQFSVWFDEPYVGEHYPAQIRLLSQSKVHWLRSTAFATRRMLTRCKSVCLSALTKFFPGWCPTGCNETLSRPRCSGVHLLDVSIRSRLVLFMLVALHLEGRTTSCQTFWVFRVCLVWKYCFRTFCKFGVATATWRHAIMRTSQRAHALNK